MAIQGQSFFQCSGDALAYTNHNPFFPADNPFITIVGGTTLTTNSNGSYNSEEVWNNNNQYGSSGGISINYSIPFYQQSTDMSQNGGSQTMRNIPDVALVADNIYIFAKGTGYPTWGTSFATPLWAGFIALVNQNLASYDLPSIGLINPAIYSIGNNPSQYVLSFNDIRNGNNSGFTSEGDFNYDLCTGWGTIKAQGLLNALSPFYGNMTFESTITIPSNNTITILPGTNITFTNGASLIVNGTLDANGGSSSHPITFDFVSPNSSTHNGIQFNSGSSGTISYCRILHADRGIYENNVSVNITNSAFSNCTNGIYLYYSSPTIQSNDIHNNSYGVYLLHSSPLFYINYIESNSTGVNCTTSSNPQFGYLGNNITNNSTGVYCWNNSSPNLGNYSYGGWNNILNNSNASVYNMSSNGVYAIHNWWGSTNPGSFNIKGMSSVVSSPYLYGLVTGIPEPPLSKSNSNIYASGNDSIPMLSELNKANQLIASNNLESARSVCLNLVNNYPDYCVSYNALNLLRDTYSVNDITDKKSIYKSLFDSKEIKNINAMAGLILADLDKENRLNIIDQVIDKYKGQSIVELAMFDKFVLYYFDKDDKESAVSVSKDLDKLFPNSIGAIETHRILGDEENITLPKALTKTSEQVPAEFSLLGNYPNPFNPITTISYNLPHTSSVEIEIYDILGNKIRSFTIPSQSAGRHGVVWNGTNSNNEQISSGIYLYHFKAVSLEGKNEAFEKTAKLILLK